MAVYILLTQWTNEGVATYADLEASDDLPAQRERQIEQALAAVNAELVSAYWTLGEFDVVLVVQAAGNEEIGGFALAMSQQGMRTQTLPAFDAESAARVIATAKICGQTFEPNGAPPAGAGPN